MTFIKFDPWVEILNDQNDHFSMIKIIISWNSTGQSPDKMEPLLINLSTIDSVFLHMHMNLPVI